MGSGGLNRFGFFTLLPVLATLKFQFIRLHLSMATCVYCVYHILGAYMWIEVNQILKAQAIDEEKWEKIFKYDRIHNVVSWIVLLLLGSMWSCHSQLSPPSGHSGWLLR